MQFILAELDESLNPKASYLQGPGIDRPLMLSKSGQNHYYHPDILGSIAALTDQAGKVSASYRTDAFGNIFEQKGNLQNSFIFTGREYETNLGLYYYRARFYDPALGRFLGEDPEWTPAKLNKYAYALNAPTRYRDPLGLSDDDLLRSFGLTWETFRQQLVRPEIKRLDLDEQLFFGPEGSRWRSPTHHQEEAAGALLHRLRGMPENMRGPQGVKYIRDTIAHSTRGYRSKVRLYPHGLLPKSSAEDSLFKIPVSRSSSISVSRPSKIPVSPPPRSSSSIPPQGQAGLRAGGKGPRLGAGSPIGQHDVVNVGPPPTPGRPVGGNPTARIPVPSQEPSDRRTPGPLTEGRASFQKPSLGDKLVNLSRDAASWIGEKDARFGEKILYLGELPDDASALRRGLNAAGEAGTKVVAFYHGGKILFMSEEALGHLAMGNKEEAGEKGLNAAYGAAFLGAMAVGGAVAPTATGVYVAVQGGRYLHEKTRELLETTDTGRYVDKKAEEGIDTFLHALFQDLTDVKAELLGDEDSWDKEVKVHHRRKSAFIKALQSGQIRLKDGVTTKDLELFLKTNTPTDRNYQERLDALIEYSPYGEGVKDCPEGYVLDNNTGRCVSPMDDLYRRSINNQQDKQERHRKERVGQEMADLLKGERYTLADTSQRVEEEQSRLRQGTKEKIEGSSDKQPHRGEQTGQSQGADESEDESKEPKSENNDVSSGGQTGGAEETGGKGQVFRYVAFYVVEASFILERANILEKKQYEELEEKVRSQGRQTKIIAESKTIEQTIKKACSKLNKQQLWRGGGCNVVAFDGDIRMCIDRLRLKNQDYACNVKAK